MPGNSNCRCSAPCPAVSGRPAPAGFPRSASADRNRAAGKDRCSRSSAASGWPRPPIGCSAATRPAWCRRCSSAWNISLPARCPCGGRRAPGPARSRSRPSLHRCRRCRTASRRGRSPCGSPCARFRDRCAGRNCCSRGRRRRRAGQSRRGCEFAWIVPVGIKCGTGSYCGPRAVGPQGAGYAMGRCKSAWSSERCGSDTQSKVTPAQKKCGPGQTRRLTGTAGRVIRDGGGLIKRRRNLALLCYAPMTFCCTPMTSGVIHRPDFACRGAGRRERDRLQPACQHHAGHQHDELPV